MKPTSREQRICSLTPVYTSTAHNPFDAERMVWQELRKDPLYPSLTSTQREFQVTKAMALGREQAAKYADRRPEELAAELGASVKELDGENLIAGRTVYAEYDAGTRQITLYRKGIAQLAQRLAAAFPDADPNELARSLLLAHELFHHIEATQIASQPPHSRSGESTLFRRKGVVRHSEMAAHAFAVTLLHLP